MITPAQDFYRGRSGAMPPGGDDEQVGTATAGGLAVTIVPLEDHLHLSFTASAIRCVRWFPSGHTQIEFARYSARTDGRRLPIILSLCLFTSIILSFT